MIPTTTFRICPLLCLPAALVALLSCGSAIAASPTFVDLSADLEYSPYHNANPGSDALLDTIASQPDPIRTALVLEHGKIVASYARDDVVADSAYPVFSVTKSWISLMIGMLIDDGALMLNETLGDIFLDKRCPDGVIWALVEEADFVQNVTIHEMLTMTSGLVSPAIELDMDLWSHPYVQANHGGANLTDSLNYLEIGTKGELSYVGTSQILSYVIMERSALTPRQFANERIFPLLGIDGSKILWDENYDEMQHAFSGLYLTPEQMAKFGQLYLQKGLAAGSSPGSRIVSEEWVQESSSRQADPGFPGLSYGYLFWLCECIVNCRVKTWNGMHLTDYTHCISHIKKVSRLLYSVLTNIPLALSRIHCAIKSQRSGHWFPRCW